MPQSDGLVQSFPRLSEEARERLQEAEVISEVSRVVTSTLDIGEVYERVGEEIRKLVPFDRIVISTVDQEAGVSTIRYIHGEQMFGRSASYTMPLEGSETEQMISLQGSMILGEPTADSPTPVVREAFRVGMRSGIRVPLVSKGRMIGSIILRSRQPGFYGPGEQRILGKL